MIRLAPAALVVVALVLPLAGAAGAQTTRRVRIFGTKVALDCHILQFKEMVVTNLTPSTIAAGTTIFFDATRYGGGDHYTGSFASPALGSGASAYHSVGQSSSCSAWYVKTPFLNPNRQNQLQTR